MRERIPDKSAETSSIGEALERIRSVSDDLLRWVEPAAVYRVEAEPPAGDASTPANERPRPPADHELAFLGLREAAGLVRSRAVSPVELLRACLEQADRCEPAIRSLLSRADERALAEARAAEREIVAGRYLGELHGIPITIKDIIDVSGLPTTAASPLLADNVAAESAPVAGRLQQRGAIVFAKANTHQFAWGGTTPPTRNAWDTDRIPGGSSGGSGASLAAGIGYASVGSDTGGSVRSPAGYNGVVGLKATHGRIPKAGVYPLAWSLDAAGPMARRVEDVALLLDAVSGHHPGDPSSLRSTPVAALPTVRAGARGLRVGVIEDYFFAPIQPDVEGVVRSAIAALSDAGAVVKPVALHGAELVPLSLPVLFVLIVAESAAWHRSWLRSSPDLYRPEVLAYMSTAEGILATDYLDAQRVRRMIQAAVESAFADVDVLAVPNHTQVAPRVDDEFVAFGDGSTLHRDPAGVRNLGIFNLTGHPAVSVPAGLAGGLPVGLQLIGRHHDDATVLRAAQTLEEQLGTLGRPPCAR